MYESSWLGVESELHLQLYPTPVSTPELSGICDYTAACLNPLSEARDQVRILMGSSWVRYHLSHNGNSLSDWV